MNKPVIPDDVADAIEHLRSDQHNNMYILEYARHVTNAHAAALRSIPFDTLLAALVNDYEREKTPEQLAEEQRVMVRQVYEDYRKRAERLMNMYNGTHSSIANAAYADGILFAVQTLGIEIEGVNA